jgi:hypothetical protein
MAHSVAHERRYRYVAFTLHSARLARHIVIGFADQRGTIEHGGEPVVPLGFSRNPMASTYAPRATDGCFRPVLCVAESRWLRVAADP